MDDMATMAKAKSVSTVIGKRNLKEAEYRYVPLMLKQQRTKKQGLANWVSRTR